MSTSKKQVQNAVFSGSNDPSTRQKAPARPLDPNVLQRRAAEPETSVWVSASAGTGKTKVLTDRVLRLLLPRASGEPGCKAHKILCLTFTKAGAGEMSLRISKTLAEWAVLEETKLREKLTNLLDRPIKPEDIRTARTLFADVVDAPGGLKIMTIHAFCQSVLGRFPLEANISPNFKVLEEQQAQDLLHKAINNVLSATQLEQSSPLTSALNYIAATINEEQFIALLKDVIRERGQFERLRKQHFNIDGLYTHICTEIGIQPGQTREDYLRQQCEDTSFPKDAIKATAQAMLDVGSPKTDQPNADIIMRWISAIPEERTQNFENYSKAFLTQKQEVKARLATKAVFEHNPDAENTLKTEAMRIIAILDTLKTIENAKLTRDILLLGEAILESHQTLKTEQNALDFDDLILRTLGLLRGETMNVNIEQASSWIHYKLDQGLDHILIDEAQDTNPEQWQILKALTEEFYTGTINNDTKRTVFTVGDEKQSIYSFQRASPEEFSKMKSYFHAKTQSSEGQWDEVPMNTSFRSVRSILEAVDAVFEPNEVRDGLGENILQHTAFRRGQAGHVELWPIFESDEKNKLPLWESLSDSSPALNGQTKLAAHIARTIRQWIDSNEQLPAHDRPLRPGDIMILVKTRSALVHHIARALKDMNIPVSGLDRMVLTAELVIEDLMALAKFALQPQDDLTLATILKSPLIGMDEDSLFTLCHNRSTQSVLERLNSDHPNIAEYLKKAVHWAGSLTPFEFITTLCYAPCPASGRSGIQAFKARLGDDVLDPITEFLNHAQTFQREQTPHLLTFLHMLRDNVSELKREQEDESDRVRIMTVHGSKGLQAPIVILPDTTGGISQAPSRAEKRLLWPDQSNLEYPLWSPRKDMDSPPFSSAMEHLDHKLEQEHRRLLYVAMTRAEDRLYVGGALGFGKTADKTPENCWYSLIQRGLQRADSNEELNDGTLILKHPQTQKPDKGGKQGIVKAQKQHALPDWAISGVESVREHETILRPSRIDDNVLSPLENQHKSRFLRGNLTHKLLQILPDLPDDKRHAAAMSFLTQFGQDFSTDIHKDITAETLQILDHPDFKPLFGPNSQAEVPIGGTLTDPNGLKQRISGQIDRLCITDTHILIVDYKTNRPPPTNPQDIPDIYRKQMQTYASVLKQIYPQKTVKSALLWTDGPSLMPLDL